jgi:hypothetical protein
MSIDTTKLIKVLNFNSNPVVIETHVKGYVCESAQDEDDPSITPLSISEIESLNSKTNAFKIGTLRFPKEIEKEMYEDILRISEWQDILTNKQIKEIILHPNLEGLQKIIELKNVALFERVRGIFHMLKNSNEYDISNRVEKIVTLRYKELCNQQVKTNIQLSAKDTKTTASSEEVSALKEANLNMQAQMEQMQKMMEQMMAMQQANQSAVAQPETNFADSKSEDESAGTTKKAGRPTTKK